MLFGGGFFVYTFIQQKLFMNSLLYHRLLYMLILLMGTVWFLVTTYFAKNSERRYRILSVMYTILAIVMYAFVLGLAFINVHFNHFMDPTIFMTVALLVRTMPLVLQEKRDINQL